MASTQGAKTPGKPSVNSNEWETVLAIVSENRGLLNRVLDKIRAQRNEAKKDVLAMLKEKKNQEKK
jgi:hypothetical protein